MPKAIILSGPSGSGKTTWAKANYPEAIVCSADHHFVDSETGESKFDPSQIAEAHSNCLNKFILECRCQMEDIVVDNTNLNHWERQNYHDIARCNEYEVEYHNFVVATVREIWICAKRNKHGVPAEVVAKMAMNHNYSPGFMHKVEGSL